MVLGSNGAVQEAVVLAGFGVALLPLDAVGARVQGGAVAQIDCPGTPIDRPWHLVAPAAVPVSPMVRARRPGRCSNRGGFTPTPDGRRLLRQ